MPNRYHRQLQVPQLGQQAQATLQRAQVLLVGAGGLGSIVAPQLVGAGIGHLTILDHDTVSLSNLHRQTLYTESDIGLYKAEVASARLTAINSEVMITSNNTALSIENARAFVQNASVVVDAADSFIVSYLLSDLCYELRVPLVSASVLTTKGYLGVYCGTNAQPAPSLRAIFPTPPATTQNCDTAGVTGPSVGVIGSFQAQETLKVILQSSDQLLGKLLTLDLWQYRQDIIDFSTAPEPTHYPALVDMNSLTSSDCLLDVRTPIELQGAPYERSDMHIEANQIKRQHAALPKGQRIVCICKSGQRALYSANTLLELGYQNVAVTMA